MSSRVQGGSESQWVAGADSPPGGVTSEVTAPDECGVWESPGGHAHGTGAGPWWKWSLVHHLERLSS